MKKALSFLVVSGALMASVAQADLDNQYSTQQQCSSAAFLADPNSGASEKHSYNVKLILQKRDGVAVPTDFANRETIYAMGYAEGMIEGVSKASGKPKAQVAATYYDDMLCAELLDYYLDI